MSFKSGVKCRGSDRWWEWRWWLWWGDMCRMRWTRITVICCAICNHSAAICDRMSPTLKSTGGWVTLGPNLGCSPWSRPVMLGCKEWTSQANQWWNYFRRISTYVITIHQRHRQTDDMRSQYRALH